MTIEVKSCELLLRVLAIQSRTARLKTGERLHDSSDFRHWFLELADEAAKSTDLETFLQKLRGQYGKIGS